jgi:thiamine biosynthesis lipoprotein
VSCAKHEPSRFEFALGTVCVITLYDNGLDGVYNDIFNRISEIENLMSVNIPTSDISRINAAAGIESVIVHKDTFKVIERAVYFARLSDGAFDPTVKPLVSLWGFDDVLNNNHRVPSQEEINAILPLINWRNIELDSRTNSVFLKEAGMALDLGAIAKGFAADEAAAIARDAGLKRGLFDLGGDIVMLGEKTDRSPWRVGIRNPEVGQNNIAGFVEISMPVVQYSRSPTKTVVTSGVYERFFEADGKLYHHLFNSLSGYPVENELLSVTVISNNSMNADALSTAIFALGYEAGSAMIELFPETGAIFVFKDRSIRITPGVDFILTDRNFNQR